MKMKRFIPLMVVAAMCGGAMTSCEDMMDMKSGAYVFDDGNGLDSANDSLYSAMGILTQMQKIGERYVLLGELRGDLADVTGHSTVSMQEVSAFATTAGNDYSSRRDYYAIINNCNYALARMDTTVTEHLNRVMVPEYVAIKTMRAWTYLQMGLTFGRVQWIDRPILSLEDSEMDYPVVGLDELVDKLIADLERYAANTVPDYGSVDMLNSRNFFIEPRVLLGDLYLMCNRYHDAARMYYDYIRNHQVCLISAFCNSWATSQAMEVKGADFLSSYVNEVVMEIPYSSETKKYHPDLINLTYNAEPKIVAAPWWIQELASASHFHIDNWGATTVSGFLEGDLRGQFISSTGKDKVAVSLGDVALAGNAGEASGLITKFYNTAITGEMTNPDNALASGAYQIELPVYRYPHLYLRYAEAVNRMGKPTLAFAVLKYGLRPDVVADETKVDPSELEDGLAYTNFSGSFFESNRGTASRGRGLGVDLSQSTYVLPEFETEQELMEWIEDEIVREMAAETMFEGNRFFDLMRISRHRGGNEYFADKVSRRFSNQDAAKALLMNQENWWVK